MENSKSSKKPFVKRKFIWVLIVLAMLFVWPMGLILLFIKLTDMRREREDRVPLETFLSYSADKTKEENELALAKERSALRALRATKLLAPFFLLLGGLMVAKAVQLMLAAGYSMAGMEYLLRGIICLLFALLCGFYCCRQAARQKRMLRYMKSIGREKQIELARMADETGVPAETVAEDIRYMIKRQFFSKNACVDEDGTVFYRYGREGESIC